MKGVFFLWMITALPQASWAAFCVGVNCGANDPSFHCHSRNALGNECWDQVDNACEAVTGFSRTEAFSCFEPGPGTQGAVGIAGQLPTAIGGFNTFRSQIRRPAVSRKATEDLELQDLQEIDDASGDDDDGGAVYIAEMTAALEHETWDLLGVEGKTNGIRFGWQRQNPSGGLWGVAASYQQAESDVGGDSTDLINANFSYGHTLGSSEIWQWSASATISDLSGFVDETLIGASGQLSFQKDLSNSLLSGGLVLQYQTADQLDDDIATVGLGLAWGIPLGRRLTLDFDVYAVNIVEPALDDDLFYTLGGSLGYYFSRRFALNLGYRVLEGIDGLDSSTITLGSISRW
jgi:hypothetical protein